ncbi:FxLYD domain-containing protein [Kineococcus sp. G2]|uniref:FxLYD domain-containing protein n=1 Tax=Kineococcus sp. G2 TaxID=3127484 RepID=UPI00301E0D12
MTTRTPTPPAPPRGRRRPGGVAIASVVLGLAGALTGLVPSLHVLALCLAVLGAAAGLVALLRGRGPVRRTAAAGLVLSLAAAAVVVAVTAAARDDVVTDVVEDAPGDVAGELPADPAGGLAGGTRPSGSPEGVAVTGCGEPDASGAATAVVEVTNTAQQTRSLAVAVEWMDAADAQLGVGRAVARDLAPGESTTVRVEGTGVGGAVACRALEVVPA